jgi:periplasmic protein TonB
MKYLHTVILLLISISLIAQKVNEEEIFTAVEQQAEFPGGMGAFSRYLQKKLKWEFKENEIRPSKLYFQFVVEKNGTISQFKVLKGPLSKRMQQNFLNLFSSIKWKPGYQNGKPVRSRFTLPINDLNHEIAE